jgi:hypothetical protein
MKTSNVRVPVGRRKGSWGESDLAQLGLKCPSAPGLEEGL